MKYAIILVAAAMALAGCSSSDDRIAFDGKYFRAKVAKVDGQRDVFQVSVRDASQSIEGAREAGRYEAISYCVETYGSSKIDWAIGPDTPADQLRLVDNTLVLQGTCPQ